MADRSFSETPKTRGELPAPLAAPLASFNSSPTVLTRRRRGDAAVPVGAPIGFTAGSATLVTLAPVSRSNQSLPMMPLTDGVAPLSIVAWPIAVTVG
jgi:hypothetical protein